MKVKPKAQSILEYIIVLSAIVTAVIAAAENLIKPAVTRMFTDCKEVIEEKSTLFHTQAASNVDRPGNR